jgi:RNA polymerase sigma factor (sigma-70 family)
MPDGQTAEIVFLEHLSWINRVAAMTCTQHGVWGAEAEDFASLIHMKLIEDDYAAIRNFRGESSLRTYLATVVVRQFHDYRREQRGRWRISAAAERLGSPAGELEALIYRDGYALEQAGELLRTMGRTTLSDTELARLLDQLPRREPLRPVEVPPDVLDGLPSPSPTDRRVIEPETDALRRRVNQALARAMDRLPPEDRMIVRMHFQEGRTLADVARALNLKQKPLYRRVARLLETLRAYLRDEGVQGGDVNDLLGEAP